MSVGAIDPGLLHRGSNHFSVIVRNNTAGKVTVVLDLRADPGLWLRKNQRQFIYLLYPGEERALAADYEFERMSVKGTLRVRLSFPAVGPAGATDLGKPFFERRYTVDPKTCGPDYELSRFALRETKHFSIYYLPGSLAARDIDRIAAERDAGVERVADALGVEDPGRIDLVFFPDQETKLEETGHHGDGWAVGRTIVEVYSATVRLDPFHEATHVVAQNIGYPAAMLNEGFAVYMSETLGSDALAHLGSPGKTCDAAVRSDRAAGRLSRLGDLLALEDIGPPESRAGTSYPQACSVAGFLIRQFGMEKFRTAYATVDVGGRDALEKVYGLPVEELERRWLASIGTR